MMTLDAALIPLGWDAAFAAALATLGEPLLQPARVCRAGRGHCSLLTGGGELEARESGLLRRAAPEERPAVGDWVAYAPGGEGGTDVVRAVLPRRTCFVRAAPGSGRRGSSPALQVLAANVDTALIVGGLDRDYNPRRIERYLTLAWESGARPVVLLNKADLCPDAETRRAETADLAPGVPVHLLCASTGAGLEELLAELRAGETAVLLGSSGVGKSTLLNRLAGRDLQATGEVSAAVGKGRHTTTRRELFRLPEAGLIIDTPGLREIQLWAEPGSLSATFAEIEVLARACRFADCRHRQEPGCAVQEAAASGELSPERLESFHRQQQELDYLERRGSTTAQAEQRRKWKAIHKGKRRFLREE